MLLPLPHPQTRRPVAEVLSVSPEPDDHVALQGILEKPATQHAIAAWRVSRTASIATALQVLARDAYPVVVCERDLPDGDWRELVAQSHGLADRPYVIVTSRHADDRLWAEALNLGAYDVLAKPFDSAEVSRVLTSACLRWEHETNGSPPRERTRAAFGSDWRR